MRRVILRCLIGAPLCLWAGSTARAQFPGPDIDPQPGAYDGYNYRFYDDYSGYPDYDDYQWLDDARGFEAFYPRWSDAYPLAPPAAYGPPRRAPWRVPRWDGRDWRPEPEPDAGIWL